MTRIVFPFPSAAAVLLIFTGIAANSPAQQAGASPPKELLQYVHDAKRSGVKEDKIRQQAVVVGWPAAVVDQALAFDKGGKTMSSAKSDTAAATPASAQASPERGPAPVPEKIAPVPDKAASEKALPASAEGPAPPFEIGVKTPVEPAGTVGNPRISDVPQDYQIAAGDTLRISVWKEPDVSVPSEIVRPDGKITVPLIKEIEVAGLTPKQVEKMVTEQLSKYYTDANVTVEVTMMAPKKVYVTGGVRKEGPVPFTAGMTVMQAISEAGGLTDYAKRKRIYILRTENGREYRLNFNYDEVVKGIRVEQNYVLSPSDTVVVPN